MERFYPIGEKTCSKPHQAYEGDAGYDLFSGDRVVIRPGVVTPVHTGYGVRLRHGECGLVCPRSGLATSGLTVVNAPGVVDSGYHGEIVVLLTSLADEVEIIQGMAIAQLVIVQHMDYNIGKRRDKKGFGSSDQG